MLTRDEALEICETVLAHAREAGVEAAGHGVETGKHAATLTAGRPPAAGVRHAVLKHTPGKRCVIEYWIDLPGADEERIIGKVYRGQRGARVWLGGRWSETSGFVADVIRLRPPREFEIVKVAGPARGYDAARGRVEIAGFTVVMNGRTMLGTGEDTEDDE